MAILRAIVTYECNSHHAFATMQMRPNGFLILAQSIAELSEVTCIIERLCCLLVFSRAVALFNLWGLSRNLSCADDLQMTESEILHWRIMSSGTSSGHLPELPNFMQYYTCKKELG